MKLDDFDTVITKGMEWMLRIFGTVLLIGFFIGIPAIVIAALVTR